MLSNLRSILIIEKKSCCLRKFVHWTIVLNTARSSATAIGGALAIGASCTTHLADIELEGCISPPKHEIDVLGGGFTRIAECIIILCNMNLYTQWKNYCEQYSERNIDPDKITKRMMMAEGRRNNE